jgi:hypothetical protein
VDRQRADNDLGYTRSGGDGPCAWVIDLFTHAATPCTDTNGPRRPSENATAQRRRPVFDSLSSYGSGASTTRQRDHRASIRPASLD